jgi:heat shock protein HtpX
MTESLDFVLRILIVERKNQRSPVSQLFTRTALPVVGLLLRLSIRPSFYLAADQLAAQLVNQPRELASALWKLESYSDTVPLKTPLSAAHVFIVSPLRESAWTRPLAAQPTTSLRIKKLIGYFPI